MTAATARFQVAGGAPVVIDPLIERSPKLLDPPFTRFCPTCHTELFYADACGRCTGEPQIVLRNPPAPRR